LRLFPIGAVAAEKTACRDAPIHGFFLRRPCAAGAAAWAAGRPEHTKGFPAPELH
jgi:hypothetical protein